jgi:ABC-type phosphate transport system substrate-binding protein
MTLASARRLVSACILPAAALVALAGPSAASAAFKLGHCEGVNIEGNGSTFQKLAEQEVWTPDFNTSKSASACFGAAPTVKYISTGSGPGLESWGVETKPPLEVNFSAKNAYVGTDNAPNQKQKEEIEKHAEGVAGKLQELPVEQGAVSVSVHLPGTCTATSTEAPGRLVLKNPTLEKIFRGTITKWTQIKDGGDKFLGCTKAEQETHIQRSVRLEGSGTTAIFMKYLWLSDKLTKVVGGRNWKENGELAANTEWPEEGTDPVIRGKGNGGVATETASHASSIAYINLADARKNGSFSPPTGGAGKQTFWVEITNQLKPTTKYADPSSNGDVEERANSNCEEEIYTNGKKKFPPVSTEVPWNEVTTATAEPRYPICGLTYLLSLSKFKPYPGTTEEEARTAFDFIGFVLNAGPEGGRALLGEKHDYLGLPEGGAVQKLADEGLAKISFE